MRVDGPHRPHHRGRRSRRSRPRPPSPTRSPCSRSTTTTSVGSTATWSSPARFDDEAGNLQRQGQLALWVPSHGQEAAQVGSAHAPRAQDHDLPRLPRARASPSSAASTPSTSSGCCAADARRLGPGEHRQLPPVHAGDRLADPARDRLRHGRAVRQATATGDPEHGRGGARLLRRRRDRQGDVSEALVFAASYQTPQVFFLQNNHWAISVPVTTQSRTPLYLRGAGFGIPSSRSTATTCSRATRSRGALLDAPAVRRRARAHRGADLPDRRAHDVRRPDEVPHRAGARSVDRARPDPPVARHLESRGAGPEVFDGRRRRGRPTSPPTCARTCSRCRIRPPLMFDHVYSEPHPRIDAQQAWLADYEASFGEGA